MLDRYQAIDPKKLRFGAHTKVLDVGCGTGRHILELSRFPGTFVGLDMARADLQVFRNWLGLTEEQRGLTGTVHIIEGDGEHLPFADGYFDTVLCTETLEHVPNDRAIVCELLRVLKPGGTLVISVPDEYSERILWKLSPRYRNTPGGHIRIYGREDIQRLFRESGAIPFAVDYRHSLEAVRWIAHATIDKEWAKPGRVSRFLRWLLDTPSHRHWRGLAWADELANRVLPKSIVLYGRKAFS